MMYSSIFNRQHNKKKWYSISNNAESTEIMIYNEIGGYGIQASDFVEELNNIKSPTIKVRLNTPGGDVFDGIAIYNSLKKHPAKVEAHIEGVAASIGSVIALAGDKVFMSKSGHYMIHNVWGAAIGDASEFRKTADRMDKIAESIVGIYADRTGHSEEKIKTWMADETWFSGDEAKSAGFVDEVTEGTTVKAKFDLSIYDKTPDGLQVERAAIVDNIREFETALRDEFGLSHSQAKKIAAGGWSALARDEQEQGFGEILTLVQDLKHDLIRN
jgi:ATP-dependent Clp protease protease subunit